MTAGGLLAAVELLTSYGAAVAPTKKWRKVAAELRAAQPDATRMYRLLLKLLLDQPYAVGEGPLAE